ncbi:hypothetical protein [Gracilibacillus kekensis]|uniref:hypothetical protein n=1 Tax=Gracilibacillus kekensis TaxID=1027249 RepID=UPI000932DBF3|nr:hypothetical protein [Gracilibacillus kekensis]
MKKRRYYSKNYPNLFFLTVVLSVIVTLLIYIFIQLFSTERKVINFVEEFYQYEQKGDFSNSWELFHSHMKEKFDKTGYIQDRAHVFFDHFGVDTFEFKVTDAEKIKGYQLDQENNFPQTAYRLTVIYFYESKYGYLEIHQPVIVLEEDQKWTMLWED